MATAAYWVGARVVVDNPGEWDHGKAGEVVGMYADDAWPPVMHSVHLDSEPMGTSRWYNSVRLKPEQATAPKGEG